MTTPAAVFTASFSFAVLPTENFARSTAWTNILSSLDRIKVLIAFHPFLSAMGALYGTYIQSKITAFNKYSFSID